MFGERWGYDFKTANTGRRGKLWFPIDSLLPPLSSPIHIPPPPNLEAGSARLGWRKPRVSTELPPWPRDVIVISYSETELRRAAEEVAAPFLSPRLVGSDSSRGWCRFADRLRLETSQWQSSWRLTLLLGPPSIRGADRGTPQVSFPVFLSESLHMYSWVPPMCWA